MIYWYLGFQAHSCRESENPTMDSVCPNYYTSNGFWVLLFGEFGSVAWWSSYLGTHDMGRRKASSHEMDVFVVRASAYRALELRFKPRARTTPCRASFFLHHLVVKHKKQRLLAVCHVVPVN